MKSNQDRRNRPRGRAGSARRLQSPAQLPGKPGQVANSNPPGYGSLGNRPWTPPTEQLRALLARQQAERERDKDRLAHEIHAHLAQNLALLAMELSSLELGLGEQGKEPSPVEIREKVRELTAVVHGMIEWTRKIRTELRPMVLEQFGLAAALEWRSAQLQKQAGIPCHCRAVPADITADPGTAIALYRIFEAVLSNVVRHAGATCVRTRLEAKDGQLILEVKDNGRGVAENEIADVRSLGLAGMREQARRLGGAVHIRGIAGKGTTVTVQVPLSGPSAASVGAA